MTALRKVSCRHDGRPVTTKTGRTADRPNRGYPPLLYDRATARGRGNSRRRVKVTFTRSRLSGSRASEIVTPTDTPPYNTRRDWRGGEPAGCGSNGRPRETTGHYYGGFCFYDSFAPSPPHFFFYGFTGGGGEEVK